MARIRTIKPEFWRHEALCEQPEATHMLAAALLNYADDYGYFNANPKLIAGEIYPLREPSVSIPESLRRLQTISYIRLGTGSDGRRYGQVVEFEKHQRVSHPTDSKISCISITWDTSDSPPENITKAPENFRPEQGTGKGKEQGTGNPAPRKRVADVGDDPEFEDFWKAFGPPKNAKKPDARKAWKQGESLRPAQADLLKAVAAYNIWLAEEWRKNRREFPSKQHPATWLRGEVWAGYLANATAIDVDDGPLRAMWGGQAAPLVQEIGAPKFKAWFAEAELEPGPPPALVFKKPMQQRWVASHFEGPLRKIFGDVTLKVAA